MLQKKRIRIALSAGVVLLLLLVGGAWLTQQLKKPKQAEETAAEEKSENSQITLQAVPVSAQKAFVGDLVVRVTATGVTEAYRRVTISPKVGGEIINLPVRNGTRVNKGDLLLQLDDYELRLALARAKDQLLGAQSQYGFMSRDFRVHERELAQSESQNPGESPATNPELLLELEKARRRFERVRRLVSAGLLPEDSLLQARFEMETAEILAGLRKDEVRRQKSGLTRAYLEVRQAELNLSYATIHAPFSGTVADLTVQQGQTISPGKECLSLLDLSRIRVKLQVLESEIGLIAVGRNASLSLPAYPGQTFSGKVSAINPVVNSETKTTEVEVLLPNPEQKILPGMFVEAKLDARIYPNRLLVPKEAILVRDQRKLVFVVRDGLAKWCYVTTGLENDEFVEILDSKYDLKPGEPVITDGHYTLVHDARVKIINSE